MAIFVQSGTFSAESRLDCLLDPRAPQFLSNMGVMAGEELNRYFYSGKLIFSLQIIIDTHFKRYSLYISIMKTEFFSFLII